MGLKVIGAGFGRTGTLSLKLALEQLGFGPCYHMAEVMAHPGHDAMWLALARGETSDWRPVLAGFNATVDWPAAYFWRELAADNPGAKIILTLRDSDTWYRSAAATIFARMREFEAKALRAEAGTETVDSVRARRMEMMVNRCRPQLLILDKTFGGSLDKANAIAVFNAHNEAVRRAIAPERLLVYEPGQGWEPLCRFLGVALPATPYPKVNATEQYLKRHTKVHRIRRNRQFGQEIVRKARHIFRKVGETLSGG